VPPVSRSSSSEAGSVSVVTKVPFQGSQSYPVDRVTRHADLCHRCLGRSLGRRQRQALLRSFLRLPSKAPSRTQWIVSDGPRICDTGVPVRASAFVRGRQCFGFFESSQSYPVDRVTLPTDLCRRCFGRRRRQRRAVLRSFPRFPSKAPSRTQWIGSHGLRICATGVSVGVSVVVRGRQCFGPF
jgi:hypothetical protein